MLEDMNRRLVIVSFPPSCGKDAEPLMRLESEIIRSTSLEACPVHLPHGQGQLEALAKEDCLVLPLLVQKGSTYKAIRTMFPHTAPPLLDSDENMNTIASALCRKLIPAQDRRYILIAHGDGNEPTEEYSRFSSFLRKDMSLVTLKGTKSYTSFHPQERTLVLVPFLLCAGHHAKHDIMKKVLPHYSDGSRTVSMREQGLLTLVPEIRNIFLSRLHSMEKDID